MLSISDPFIIQKCILQCNSAEFMFGHSAIDGLMLFKPSVHASANGTLCLDICDSCHSSLIGNQMPKYALANGLYRGNLPAEFADLTWVEEMVCAIYRYTAHIVRLFQSTDPALPNVLHGNTCAHEMNVVSTASVLPRTASDVNGALSVIFIGPEKFRSELLKNIFRIRKRKVWEFLLWLRNHNILYSNIELDPVVLEEYPDDGPLPGIVDNVLQDFKSDPSAVFEEESAALFEHPATSLDVSNSSGEEPFIFWKRLVFLTRRVTGLVDAHLSELL